MKKFVQLSKRIARISYTLGSISLILGIILSFVNTPASASPGIPSELNQFSINQPNACDQMYKCESPGCEPDPYSDWTAPEGTEICMIVIKAGKLGDMQFNSNGCSVDNDGDGVGDYCASGIGTDYGEAWRTCGEDGQTSCYAISHTEYWYGAVPPTPTPTNTSTPTATDTSTPTPTDTSTPTPTDTNTPTPTDTSTPTPTGTLDPSPTPTDTSEPSPTPTGTIVTPTDTPPVDTVTPTPTSLGTMITPTSTSPISDTPTPTATDPGGEVTPTATDSGEQVTPTATQAEDTAQPTLPPPQITGTPPSILIPVTGVDLSSPLAQFEQIQLKLINLGLALLGMGLIFQGIGKKIEINL